MSVATFASGAAAAATTAPGTAVTVVSDVGIVNAEGFVATLELFLPITLALNAHNIRDDQLVPTNAIAGIRFDNTGEVTYTGNNTPSSPDTNEWITTPTIPSDQAALFEVSLTVLVSGNGPTTLAEVIGTYIALGSNRHWFLTSGAVDSGVWRFRVREIADNTNFVEADMTVTASSLP